MGQAFEDELAREVSEIVKQEIFKRAPMQARLLEYLCKRTIERDLGPITQYDIAVEALGRSDSFDETSNSYVRVQITRLRKNLSAYYSICAPSGTGYVYIKKGQYSLSLGSLHIAYPELHALRNGSGNGNGNGKSAMVQIPEDEDLDDEAEFAPLVAAANAPSSKNKAVKRGSIFTAIAIGVIGIAALGWGLTLDRYNMAVQDDEGGLDNPSISLAIDMTDPAAELPGARSLTNAIAVEAHQRLARSLILRSAEDGEDADYHLQITLDVDGGNEYLAEISLKRRDGEQIRLREQPIEATIVGARSQIGWQLSSMFSPPGLIARDIAGRISGQPANDFECFINIELGQTGQNTLNQLLEFCVNEYPDSTYYPYLKARELFVQIQNDIRLNGSLNLNPEIETELGELLRQFPDNSYLNTLAAKILFSQGNCDEGERYADNAFQMGRDYPALELAILVDKSSCVRDAQSWIKLADRIDLIVRSQPEPHAFLEAYAIAGMIMVGRSDGVDKIPERPFAFPRDLPIIELTDAMRAFARGEYQELPPELAMLVWNNESRKRIAALGQDTAFP